MVELGRDKDEDLMANLSNENVAKYQDCKKILDNQKLYAETILVNAFTGKQVKPVYKAKTNRAKNVFEQYQDNIFTATSNN